jgi:hypothetical protein
MLWNALLLLSIGCGPGAGAYCQSGPRYGTQCYTESDLNSPPGAPRRPGDEPHKGEPPANPPPTRLKW